MTTESARHARPSRVPWPLYIWGASIVGGLFLKYTAPLHFGYGPNEILWRVLGWSMILGAVAIDVWAIATFRRHRTTVMPHQGASSLITDGPFAYSRNPLYLSHTLLTLGIGVAAHTLWLILFAPLALLAARRLAVEPEEAHLEAKFGDAWRQYAARVPRWLGRRGS